MNELGPIQAANGQTLYAILFNSAGQVRDVVAGSWVTYVSADRDNYDVALTEQDASGLFLGDLPTSVTTADQPVAMIYVQAGASPAETDTLVAQQSLDDAMQSGADGDTGKTLSDQLDTIATDADDLSALTESDGAGGQRFTIEALANARMGT